MITTAFRNAAFSVPTIFSRSGLDGHMTLDIRWNVDTYMAMNRTLLAEAVIWNLSAQLMSSLSALFYNRRCRSSFPNINS